MSKLSALSKLAEAKKTVTLDIETQATILGLAIKVSNQGVPYFTRDVAIAIKSALVEDKLVGKEASLFEKLKTTQAEAWFRPLGTWLSLEASVEEESETI